MPVHPDVPNLFGLHQFDGYVRLAASTWVLCIYVRGVILSSVCISTHNSQILGFFEDFSGVCACIDLLLLEMVQVHHSSCLWPIRTAERPVSSLACPL